MIREDFNNYSDVVEYLKANKVKIFNQIVSSVEHCLENSLNELIMARFYLSEDDSFFNVIIHEDDWLNSLGTARDYFEETEEYEFCEHINELIIKINNKKE